jgi:uncharacterized membrane protein
MSKTAKLVFLGSLVLNLLLVGVVVGFIPRGLEATPPVRQQRMEEALKKVPEPTQSHFREKFAQMRASTEPFRRQIDEARAETLRLLAADVFDEAAYDRQVNKIETLRAEMFKSMGQNFKQTAKELSPEERRLLAEFLRRPAPTPQ